VAPITEWLASLGMSEYAQRFSDNGVDVSVLRYSTDQDLEKIGVGLDPKSETRIIETVLGRRTDAEEGPCL
jgi:SAM domain (Sterile alpha motif)